MVEADSLHNSRVTEDQSLPRSNYSELVEVNHGDSSRQTDSASCPAAEIVEGEAQEVLLLEEGVLS